MILQAEDSIREQVRSRGLGGVNKRQAHDLPALPPAPTEAPTDAAATPTGATPTGRSAPLIHF